MRLRTHLAAALAVALVILPELLAAQGSPSRDTLVIGGRTVPAGTTVQGPVVVAGGNLEVKGTISGSAIAIAGDVVVHPGGEVTGDAIAAFGEVTNSGTVGGSTRALTGAFGSSLRGLLRGNAAVAATPRPERSPLSLALGWFTVMLLIGLGVLVFAAPYLEGVVDVLEQSFWRSFVTGLLGELGVLPVLLLVVVGLAVTVIGVLLIPFAVVAVVLAVAGLLTLGFIAMARYTGGGIGSRNALALSTRGSSLRGVLIGLTLYLGLWIAAAALVNVPVAGVALRVAAVLATFVAATTGFGAAILSRGGTRRDAAIVVAPAPASDAGWQTPTPVSGVVAARRPGKPRAEAGLGR